MRRFAFPILVMAIVLAAPAMAADAVLAASKLYAQIGPSLKLNDGAYGKMVELKTDFWAWCKTGYDPAFDTELTQGTVEFAANNAPFPEESRRRQAEIAGKAVQRYLTREGALIKEAGGTHRMDVAIALSEPYKAGSGEDVYTGWLYAAEVRITDDAGNVVFRAVLKTSDVGWEEAPEKWAREFARDVRRHARRFVQGFGVDSGYVPPPPAPVKETPQGDPGRDF